MSLTSPSPEEIKAFRLSTGMTQADLALALGSSVSVVAAWERGARTPLPMLRLALAAINERIAPFAASPET